MIIDFHTHIFPKEIRENKEKYFKNESAFKLLYESPASKIAGAEDLIADMEGSIDISVIFGFPWKDMSLAEMHNDYIIESVKKYPKKLKGFACFDISSPDACKEARRCVEEGLCGVGELAPYESGLDHKSIHSLEPLADLCRDKNIPIMIHTNEPLGHLYPGKMKIRLKEIYDMVKRFRENLIILAHWGGGILFYNLCKKEVKDIFKNLYFDTAASPFLYDERIYKIAADILGSEKILFGSDYPLLKPARYFKEIDNSGLFKEDMEKICGLNGASLLNRT